MNHGAPGCRIAALGAVTRSYRHRNFSEQSNTMTTLADLRHQREQIVNQAKDLMAKHPGKMPSDVSNQVDDLLNQAERLSGRIEAYVDEVERAGDEHARRNGEGWRDSNGQPLKALHGVEAVRAHYAAKASRPEPGKQAVALDDFVRGVAGMPASKEVKAALSVGTDTAGGYAVPSIVMPQILEALVPASSLLTAGAGIVPLDAGAKTFTTAAVDSIPTAAWRLENGAVAESAPTFRGVVAAPKSLAFYFKVSRELLADATNLTAALATAIAQAFAVEMDRAGLRGSGTNPEPRGLLNTTGVNAVASGTNGAALAGYGKFFEGAQQLLQAKANMPTAAIMSPRSLIKLGGLVDTQGQPLRRPDMLQDMKLISTPAVPDNLTVGTSTDCSEIYMGDFTRMVFMLREQMSIQVAQELFAANGQIGFVCHARVDVAVLYPQQFAIVTGVRP